MKLTGQEQMELSKRYVERFPGWATPAYRQEPGERDWDEQMQEALKSGKPVEAWGKTTPMPDGVIVN